jgi:hypothetical protein
MQDRYASISMQGWIIRTEWPGFLRIMMSRVLPLSFRKVYMRPLRP